MNPAGFARVEYRRKDAKVIADKCKKMNQEKQEMVRQEMVGGDA